MSGGTSNAYPRFRADPFYAWRAIRGRVLDVGGGSDPLYQFRSEFPKVTSWTVIDKSRLDKTLADLEWIVSDAGDLPPDREFDCIYSSHCLEHVDNPTKVAGAWWDALAVGGHLIVMVPSWWTYERQEWPPKRNSDHRTAWVPARYPGDGLPPHVRGLLDVVWGVATFDLSLAVTTPRYATGGHPDLIRLTTLDEGFDPRVFDQTAIGSCESGIEIVIRKTSRPVITPYTEHTK